MRKSIVVGAAVVLSLALAGTAQANTVIDDFDDFNLGPVGGQGGWLADAKYDQEVVDMGGGNSLRISNAVTAGSFSDMPYSTPVQPAGENADNDMLVQHFDFHSASEQQQPGLAMSVSPTGENGSRMSYVRLEDRFDGIRVFFNDATFTDKWIGTLDRTQNHEVIFTTKFVPGNDNDIVAVYVDGEQKVCGTSWENYYRFEEQHAPSVTDRLMWRLSSAPTPAQALALKGKGFIFDNLSSNSYKDDQDYTCAAPLPQGPKGDDGATGTDGQNGLNGTNGTNGTNGKDGVNGTNGTTTVVREPYTIIGASMRTLHIRKIASMKFVGAKATLGGKKLTVKGRTIKVNLRNKSVGEYIVRITAKYKAGGKTYKVRSIRSLSIIRK